ncbi:OmpA family protein [uncultured Sunxiuqinia sp.]|uniref:OmpA family protein n=1 Tax=uncultured Sunxiuqinia sp. TaxID=1573825 RepID=UPI002627C607|nr:OmpA family protein [uncultured Sunxiuqinia sp.]
MKLLSTIMALLLALGLQGQQLSTSSKKAKKYFESATTAYHQQDNQQAVEELEKALHADAQFVEALLLMADIYGELKQDSMQVVALERALVLDSDQSAKINYVLGNTCYRMGKYQRALEAFQAFLSEESTDHPFYAKASEKIPLCRFALDMRAQAIEMDAVNLGDKVNSEYNDYWPSLTVDGKTMVFTRLMPPQGASAASRHYQEDFYLSHLKEGEWQEAKPMTTINTRNNEGAQSISADGKLLFFTACTRNDGYGSCDIYYSRNHGGSWSVPQNAGEPVSSGAWESQPSITANGEYLYFASNRKGGKGGMDIWRCRLNGFSPTGRPRWSEAENLGDSINTSGNETSPFIHADGKTLYFASDTHLGLGGSDIFYATFDGDSVWQKPENLGYPINTNKDEQGLIVNAAGEYAYFSSDRPGSAGLDIYQFVLPPNIRPTAVSYVQGLVYDSFSHQPLCAQIELIDVDANRVVSTTESCWEKGEFLMCLPLGKTYAFNVSKPGYLFHSENFALKQVRQVSDPILLDIPLQAIEIGNVTVLRNIFFETGKYTLLSQSKAELNQLAAFLINNPKVKIEIGGHTDSVGGEKMNQELSENRAKAVYNYLLENGVESTRLTYRGYGFSVPVGSNETEEGRAKNRRTEFKIVATE